MNVVRMYRRAAKLQAAGLSEEETGIAMKRRQWTISRLLSLRGLIPAMADMLDGDNRVTLRAAMEIAKHSADDQRSVLPELRALVERGMVLTRADVVPALALRSRDLDRAPFPTTSCRPCLKRTGVQADFFGMVAPGTLGRCRDSACYARNLNAVKARRARWPKTKEEDDGTK